MLIQPVISNEYEVASHIIKSMLQKGLITKREYEKIDAENRRTFINESTTK
ncbi:SHOCT domain-containing protein [Anaeromusa acidaminophila]|uniref:SHOCT domain-containing protein n=1 Tax=Anaeromusa acidaminophila TaxID=81464 RepID=UPI00036BBC41|nr:SHOCT domain-containing protein [Anaeromusa acidaminophila]